MTRTLTLVAFYSHPFGFRGLYAVVVERFQRRGKEMLSVRSGEDDKTGARLLHLFRRGQSETHLAGGDNVAAGLKVLPRGERPPKRETEEIVERALRRAALWDEVADRLDNSAIALSGGQQQRLCIARALAVEPEVVLMDEPASALDPIATAKIEDLIHELKRRYTIIIVTHNMQQAARVSDQTAFFYMGELVEVGSTEQIFTNPREQRTEDYVTGKFG